MSTATFHAPRRAQKHGEAVIRGRLLNEDLSAAMKRAVPEAAARETVAAWRKQKPTSAGRLRQADASQQAAGIVEALW